ncbi:MAG TPA: endonuclease, partial [Flavobacterium sp.]
MKNLYSFILLITTMAGLAQIPTGYYNTATGTGYTLKTQLYNIIKNHDDQGYQGLYFTYTTSDSDFYYENDGTVLDMYTEKPTASECEFTHGINMDDGSGGNNECERYNREHLIPQSVFNSQTPMYSDAHFVVPSDKHVNGIRGNYPFGRVNSPTYTSN